MKYFVKDKSHYTRKIALLNTYRSDSIFYLMKMLDISEDTASDYHAKITNPETGKFPFTDPMTKITIRGKNGDKEAAVRPFSSILKRLEDTDPKSMVLMAPTMTMYTHPRFKKSILAEYIEMNIAKRSAVKQEQFVAMQQGDKETEGYNKILQTTFKVKNNSLSGAHGSAFTPLYNKSTHSTLTSTCRVLTSYSNSNNEKFICGNRHYYNSHITISNLVRLANNCDRVRIAATMDKYDLCYPSVDDVMAMVYRSTSLYWGSKSKVDRIYTFLNKCSREELASIQFTSDLYHLKESNPEFVRSLLDKTSSKGGSVCPDPEEYLGKGKIDGDTKAFVSLVCSDELMGRSLEKVSEDSPEDYNILANTAKDLTQTIEFYGEFIETFWSTDNLPCSVAAFTPSLRRCVLVSDTDSTIFTVQEWVKWFTGSYKLTAKSSAVAASVVYFASMNTIHLLATLSGNMGIVEENIFKLAMKNEFAFPAFVITSMGKHYMALMSHQEGNMLKELDLELKGVNLKTQKIPKHIRDDMVKFVTELMTTAMDGELISMYESLERVARHEQDIIDDIREGGVKYLTQNNVKGAESFKLVGKDGVKKTLEQTPFRYHIFWNEVFGPKYGEAPPPPYVGAKVTLTTDTKGKVKDWISKIEDRELAARLEKLFIRRGEKPIKTIWIPVDILNLSGMPKEILQVMDLRKLIREIMNGFYLVLESLGIYWDNKHNTKLVMDQYPVKSRLDAA